MRLSLIPSSLSKFESFFFFNELDFNQYTSNAFLLLGYVDSTHLEYSHDEYSQYFNDEEYEVESHQPLGYPPFPKDQYVVLPRLQSCLDQGGYSLSQVEDTSIVYEIIIDEIISYVGIMPHCSFLEENVSHKGTDHSLQNFFLPPFPGKEQDVTFETVHHETMVMSSCQPMNPMLCLVEPYPLLEENNGHMGHKASLATKFVLFLPLKMMRM